MSTLTPQDIRDELSRKGDLSWLYYPEQEQMLESWEKVCSQRTERLAAIKKNIVLPRLVVG